MPFSESFVTWYNAFEDRKDVKPRWHIYYPPTRALSYAHTGDQLLVARMKDDELVLVVTPKDAEPAKWMTLRAANDNRPAMLPPPKAVVPEKIPLPVALPQSFTQAKKLLKQGVYANDNDRVTFYCGCDYSKEGKIDPLSCGYTPKRPNSTRAKRLEWEHIVPAAYIGKGRMCWEQGAQECTTRSGKTYKGRKCCEKVDKQFREIEADLNNLVPEIGELNADRRDFPYREIPGEKREYGACDFEVDTKLKEAEPAVPLRGFIGRVWLYMNETHDVPITEEDRQIYTAWAKAYPPKEWEKERQKRIRQTLESMDKK